jgi:Tol biopolymer transport system component
MPAARHRRVAAPLALSTLLILLGAAGASGSAASSAPQFKAEVTWVQGTDVKLGNGYVAARGGPGFNSLNLPQYVLHPGERISATGSSTAQFYVQVGKSRAYCETDPSKGLVQIYPPSGKALLQFQQGQSTCGAVSGGAACMQIDHKARVSLNLPSTKKSVCSAPSATHSLSSAVALSPDSTLDLALSRQVAVASGSRKAGSVFRVVINPRRTVVRVQTGKLVVAAKGGSNTAVVVGANKQTVVPTGSAPTAVSTATGPATPSVVAQVQAPLPTVAAQPPPGVPTVNGPRSTSSLRHVVFTFQATGMGLTYSCRVDGGVFRLCTSPYEVPANPMEPRLKAGRHDVAVKATNPAGQTSSAGHYRWRIDGSKIVFAYTTDAGIHQIYSMNSDGTDLRDLSQSTTDDYAPALSNDGKEVAFQRTDPGTGDVNIFVMSIDGGPARQLTHRRFAANPAWSPGGNAIVFESTETGHSELYEITADGTSHMQLTFDKATATRASWSPDGRQIAFARRPGPNAPYQLYLIPAAGGTETPVMTSNCNCNELDPTWSRDGTTLAFDSRRDQQASRIYTINLSTHAITPVTTSPPGVSDQTQDSNPTWAPDGRSLAFQRLANGTDSVYVTGPDDDDAPTQIAGGTGGLPNDALVPSWTAS